MAANKLKKIRFALVLVGPFCFGLEMRKIWTAGHGTAGHETRDARRVKFRVGGSQVVGFAVGCL